MPGARAADLLLQLAARRVPALHRPRLADGDRPRARRAGPVAVDRRGRDRAVGERARRTTTSRSRRRSPRRYEVDLEAPWEDLPRGAARPLPVRHQRRPGRRHRTATAIGRKRSYATSFEGIVPNLERRYSETDSDWSREKIEEYMTLRAVPGVQGRAAAARVARGARRRDWRSTSSRRCSAQRALRVGRRALELTEQRAARSRG